MDFFVLYLLGFGTSFAVTAAALPLLRRWLKDRLSDTPGGLKTHEGAVPTVGGSAVLLGIAGSLVLIRLCTNFPSGTLHNLRGILIGGLIIFVMGLWDDLTKPRGLPVWAKLTLQAAATAALVSYGVRIQTIEPLWIAGPLTFLWVVGLTNAFNLLDIQDGLCVTQALVCTVGLTLITLPHEYIYVNFAALAVFGAGLAFWPYNHSKKHRVFLGDSGSNLIGFLIASLSLGYGYSARSSFGFLAPLLMLAVPLFDTAFVFLARVLQKKNPLKGSNDHVALRLKARGWSHRQILTAFAAAGFAGNLGAFLLTRGGLVTVVTVAACAVAACVFLTCKLLQTEPK